MGSSPHTGERSIPFVNGSVYPGLIPAYGEKSIAIGIIGILYQDSSPHTGKRVILTAASDGLYGLIPVCGEKRDAPSSVWE